MEENLGALNVQLTDEENDEIRKAVESAEVHGERYPARSVLQNTSFKPTVLILPLG